MLEQWYLDSAHSLPRFEFDVKRSLRELEDFAEANNKTRDRFEGLLQNNGLSAIEQDMILMGQHPTVAEMVREAQKKNVEERCRIRSVLEENSSAEEDMVGADFEAEEEMLDYLEMEKRYWARFLSIYTQLSPLEKIAIGRSNELKELSMEMLVELLSRHSEKRSPSSHQKQRAVVASASASLAPGGFPAHLTSLGNTCKSDVGVRRFAGAMVFNGTTRS